MNDSDYFLMYILLRTSNNDDKEISESIADQELMMAMTGLGAVM